MMTTAPITSVLSQTRFMSLNGGNNHTNPYTPRDDSLNHSTYQRQCEAPSFGSYRARRPPDDLLKRSLPMLNYISRFHVLTTLVAVFGIGCDDTTDTTVWSAMARQPMFGGNATGRHQHPDCRIINHKIWTRPGDNHLPEWVGRWDMVSPTEDCAPAGSTRCLGQGEGFRQRCNDEGQWALEGCPGNGL